MVGEKGERGGERESFIYHSPQDSYCGIIAFITVPIITERRWKYKMVSEGRGRLFSRKDGKYLIYLPKDLAEDSMFPFKGADSIFVKVGFKPGGGEKLIVERWKEAEKTP